jgi:hypothetical protein
MADFEIPIDQDNELRFAVTVEGTENADLDYRFIVEGESMSYCMAGRPTGNGEILVYVPSLKKTIREGVYNTRLEVLVDDRVFIPLKMTAHMKESVKVTAEALVKPTVKVTPVVKAAVIAESRPQQQDVKPIAPTQRQVVPQRQMPERVTRAPQRPINDEEAEIKNFVKQLFKKEG